MKMRVTFIALMFLFATASDALAQTFDGLLNWVPGIAQSRITRLLKAERKSSTTKFANAEWSKLPQAELDCINQKLRERGDSVASLSRRAIFPTDPSVADIRNQCRASQLVAPYDRSSAQPAQGQMESASTLSELRQTIEKLQRDVADSVSKISQLDKSKIELERAIKRSEQERLAAENAKYEIDKARIADKARFDAELAQLNAEKAEAIAKLQAWQLSAYAAFAALIALSIVSASVLFTWWRTAKPVTHPSYASTKLLAPPTQPDEDAETSVSDACQTSLADAGASREMQVGESAKQAQGEQRQTTEAGA